MAYSYKGSISFGLVYIPVTLHSAVRDNSISFNMIDKKTMSRVKYKKTCADCDGREVKQEDIEKVSSTRRESMSCSTIRTLISSNPKRIKT